MSDDPRPEDDREERPFVSDLLAGGYARVEYAARSLIASFSQRTKLVVWATGMILVFVGTLAATLVEFPGLGGFVRGILGGLFLALLFGLVVGWILLTTTGPESRTGANEAETPTELDTLLAPTLTELRAVRRDVLRRVKERSMVRVPLGIGGGLGLWLLNLQTQHGPGLLDLLGLLVGGAIAGEVWAGAGPGREYKLLYKSRVLPLLAARFGDLTYRPASLDEVHKLRAQRILPEFERAKADDEIVGTYRGLPLSIVEACLEIYSNSSSSRAQKVFDGLLIQLTLPRSLTGTTAVLADEGLIGNLKTRWKSRAMEPVRLEDPRFERRFEVYGTDQVEARALLTTAFMERFMALAERSRFSLPGALAEGNRLVVAMPKGRGTGDLFEPPLYWKPAGGQTLLKLEEDIRAVLHMADSVIELDFWATGRSRDELRTA